MLAIPDVLVTDVACPACQERIWPAGCWRTIHAALGGAVLGYELGSQPAQWGPNVRTCSTFRAGRAGATAERHSIPPWLQSQPPAFILTRVAHKTLLASLLGLSYCSYCLRWRPEPLR